MKTRRLLAALLVAIPATAWAADDPVLGKDDLEFARELVANRYPDLAKLLLARIQKAGRASGATTAAAIRAIELDLALDAARQIEDLVRRKDALIAVLNDKVKFIEEFKGAEDAEITRNTLPDLYSLIGETFTSAIKKTKDDVALEKLREEGNKIYEQGEAVLRARIEELKQVDPRTPETEYAAMAARYNLARTLYYHSLIFAEKSAPQQNYCNLALKEFEEFDLDFSGEFLNFDGYIYVGLALRDLGRLEEADGAFVQAVRIRETFVPDPNDPPKVWPVSAEARDIVCSAYYQRTQLREDQKKWKEIVDIVDEYLATIPDPLDAWQAMAVLLVKGEAQANSGDSKGAEETARLMIDTDPRGWGGTKGRELLEKIGGGGISWAERLRSAAQHVEREELDRGLALCRLVLADTEGTPEAAEAGLQAMLIMGVAHAKRAWWEEAAFVYHTAVERFGRAAEAPEALVRAIDCYTRANQIARRKFFKDRIDALKQKLVADYPKDPRAGGIKMLNAKQLEGENDYLGAIEILKTIDAGSPDYTAARLKIGLDYFFEVAKLQQEKKTAEAKALFPQVEAGLKDAKRAIDQAMEKTLDPKVREALDGQEYQSQVNLVRFFLMTDVARYADAATVLDGMDKRWGAHPVNGPEIQNLRGRIFLAQGKFEEAQKWVDSIAGKDPKGAAGPAGQLARALDGKGNDIRRTSPASGEADALWRTAARYYVISVTPQIRGQVTANTVELKEVGQRLFVYGLHFNGVPEARVSFVDWTPGTKRAHEFWQRTAEIYEASLAQFPDYQVQIVLGRTYGFLGRWVEAAKTYQRLFEVEALLAPGGKRLDPVVMKAKGELVYAFLEWGVAEELAVSLDKDADRYKRAINIFTALCNTLTLDRAAQIWWAAKYHQLNCYIQIGQYADARLGLEDVERNVSSTFDDGKFGYQKLLEAMREELKQKAPK